MSLRPHDGPRPETLFFWTPLDHIWLRGPYRGPSAPFLVEPACALEPWGLLGGVPHVAVGEPK